jgi:hypothetical protein
VGLGAGAFGVDEPFDRLRYHPPAASPARRRIANSTTDALMLGL